MRCQRAAWGMRAVSSFVGIEFGLFRVEAIIEGKLYRILIDRGQFPERCSHNSIMLKSHTYSAGSFLSECRISTSMDDHNLGVDSAKRLQAEQICPRIRGASVVLKRGYVCRGRQWRNISDHSSTGKWLARKFLFELLKYLQVCRSGTPYFGFKASAVLWNVLS